MVSEDGAIGRLRFQKINGKLEYLAKLFLNFCDNSLDFDKRKIEKLILKLIN